MLHGRQRRGAQCALAGITHRIAEAPLARDRHPAVRVGIPTGVQDAPVLRRSEIENDVVGAVRVAGNPADSRAGRSEMVEAETLESAADTPSDKMVGAGGIAVNADSTDFLAAAGKQSKAAPGYD